MAAKKADAAMTVDQAMDFRRMVIAKGVSKEQINAGHQTLSLALDAVKLGRLITIVPEFEVPAGWRIHTLDNVPVVLDGDWELAINEAGGACTFDSFTDNSVRRVEHLYQCLPTGTGISNCRLLLLNDAGAGWEAALTWAKQYPQLRPTVPRHVFAIGKHKPQLHYELKCKPFMYAVATTPCSSGGDWQACGVWWNGAGRAAGLRWVGYFTEPGGWFVFLCESDQSVPRASVFSEASTQ